MSNSNELTCFRDGFMDTSWLTLSGGLDCALVGFTLFDVSNYFAKEQLEPLNNAPYDSG